MWWVFSSDKVIDIIARPSIELALKRMPADSKILNGKSLHFIQGSLIKSDALNLLFGSISSKRVTINLDSLDIISGNLNDPLYIFPYNSFSLYPLNGKVPDSNAKSKTPNAHISTCLPSYSLFRTSSGAIYDGVPQNIFYFCPSMQKAANPKSIILIILVFSSINTLSSLTSRWAISFVWRYSNASPICLKNLLQILSLTILLVHYYFTY